MWRATSNSMQFGDVKDNMGKIEKDKVLRESPFDACLQILGGESTRRNTSSIKYLPDN